MGCYSRGSVVGETNNVPRRQGYHSTLSLCSTLAISPPGRAGVGYVYRSVDVEQVNDMEKQDDGGGVQPAVQCNRGPDLDLVLLLPGPSWLDKTN